MTSVVSSIAPETLQQAQQQLDRHVAEIVQWHFSPETGAPYWLDWANAQGWNPAREIRTYEDLRRFPLFPEDVLVTEPQERWIPRAYQGKPYFVFETGGTTGVPKQRISWEDHLTDYTEFSKTLDDRFFPPGGHWLMLGPTGPRRLRLSIEHLAHVRGGVCYFVDLDPRYVKKLLAEKHYAEANAYKDHVIDQGLTVLKNRRISCLFTTPKLLEALGEKISIPEAGIRGVFCGGTSMTTQVIRFLVEEVLENRAQLVPTYGNTLMGLACCKPLSPEEDYALTYYAPQPRAVLRVVNPDQPEHTVEYGEWGRVELTTLTREFFMPRFLERDEAVRRSPWNRYPWDGVGEVRPFARTGKAIVEGVY